VASDFTQNYREIYQILQGISAEIEKSSSNLTILGGGSEVD
jgi:hypothetical protein